MLLFLIEDFLFFPISFLLILFVFELDYFFKIFNFFLRFLLFYLLKAKILEASAFLYAISYELAVDLLYIYKPLRFCINGDSVNLSNINYSLCNFIVSSSLLLSNAFMSLFFKSLAFFMFPIKISI